MDEDLDSEVRLAAFDYLARITYGAADVPVRWKDLVRFTWKGRPCRLIGQRGIWKPALLDLPISITTAPVKPGRPRPYDDGIGEDDTIRYRYQGTDPGAHDNVGLRQLMWQKKPLIYFHGIERGLYLAAWPVFIRKDDPRALTFDVALNPSMVFGTQLADGQDPAPLTKKYVFVPTKRRLHQAKFRNRVMKAYRSRCSICRLAHEQLLDAAHIVPDRLDEGIAATQNGLALCKIHHAAFDGNILGIDPDLVVHVREDILEEVDGPMLQHGIKEMHGRRLSVIPRHRSDKPSALLLEERFAVFRGA